MIRNIISAIAEIDIDEGMEPDTLNAFDINNKIDYNSIRKHVSLIRELKVYHYKIDSLYTELEMQGSLKKNKILKNLQMLYIEAKGKYVQDASNPIDIIRDKSDDLIDDVRDSLLKRMEGSQLFDEDIMLGIDLVIIDAFIRCKVLEEPI